MEYPKIALFFQFHKLVAMIQIQLKLINLTKDRRLQLVINKNKCYIYNKI